MKAYPWPWPKLGIPAIGLALALLLGSCAGIPAMSAAGGGMLGSMLPGLLSSDHADVLMMTPTEARDVRNNMRGIEKEIAVNRAHDLLCELFRDQVALAEGFEARLEAAGALVRCEQERPVE